MSTQGYQSVVRVGKVLHEYLLQRGMVRAKPASGEDQIAFLFTDVLPLSEGKKAWNVFTAGSTLFPLLRKAGHKGICLHHHSFDRAQFTALDRAFRQRHKAYYTEGLGPDLGEEKTLAELTDWIVGTGCCCHDIQNAMKWALSASGPVQDLHDLHIVVESLRNSFQILMCRLPAFLAAHLSFSTEQPNQDQVVAFWRALGVEASMIDTVAEVNPWWAEGKLWVSSDLAEDTEAIEKTSFVLLYLCKWRRFNDSRWMSIGPCCRSLVWCLCIGLEAWVAFCRDDPTATDFHLHGFNRLSTGIKKYAAIACLSAHVGDSLMAEALADDRLVKKCDELKNLLVEECLWLETLEPSVWNRLASVVGASQQPKDLAHCVLHAAHVQVAYIKKSIFGQLESYPWCLAIGDVAANLDRLAETTGPIADSTTHKVRALLQVGFNRERLVAGIGLLQEVPWSTVPVEQAHASAACLHKYHPGYSQKMLSSRATLHQCRHLFIPPPEDTKEAKAASRLASLQRKDPTKVSGKHAFLAAMLQEGKQAAPSGSRLPKHLVQHIVQQHSRWFQTLPLEQQAHYHALAREEARVRTKVLLDDIRHCEDAMHLQKARKLQELEGEGLPNRVVAAKFVEDDLQALVALRGQGDFTPGQRLDLLRQEAGVAPGPPPARSLLRWNPARPWLPPGPRRPSLLGPKSSDTTEGTSSGQPSPAPGS